MRLFSSPRALSLLSLAATTSLAQHVIDELSFGNGGQLSPHGGSSIPYWQTSSAKHALQILSDRAILTPPTQGHTRGALWSEKTVNSAEWTAEIEFRASGEEMGSGNLNIFYAKDKTPVQLESAETAPRFDGLVVMFDQYGRSGGKIRGFLNDGTQDFKSNNHLESLAFGHCDYSYRNLGRPSRLKIINLNGLAVEIDGTECFRSDKISLPSGYYFGITATTAEHADSFEAWKFVVSTDLPHPPDHIVPGGSAPQGGQEQHNPHQKVEQLQKLNRLGRAPEAVPDKDAGEFHNEQEQFGDLHNRLQALSHQIADVYLALELLGDKLDDQHDHIMGQDGTGVNIGLNAKIDGLHRRLENLERMNEYMRKGYENIERIVEHTRLGYNNIEQIVEFTRKELQSASYHEHYHRINDALETMTATAPRMGFFIFVVVGVQVVLAFSYVVYKRRRANMPKKYL